MNNTLNTSNNNSINMNNNNNLKSHFNDMRNQKKLPQSVSNSGNFSNFGQRNNSIQGNMQ